MLDLHEASTFVEVLAAKSLRRAARAAGVDPTTLGRVIDRLEARLGVQLVHRSTRRLHATPIGELFAEQARELLEHARTIEHGVTELGRAPRGALRLSLCSGYARARLLPILSPWIAAHPDLHVELRLEDVPVDLAADGVDLAVRIVPGTARDVIETRLETYAHVVVAAPRWIARHGAPASPGELEQRACIAMRTDRAWTRWRFRRDGEVAEIRVRPTIEVNDAEALVALVEAGAGVTVLPAYLAGEPIRKRRLTHVLGAWSLPPGTAYAIHGRRRRLSAAARACLANLQAMLELRRGAGA